jgi:hypothetical protein
MSTAAAERRQALVVLGMHRSGTSAIARVVALAGAALPATLLPAGPDNPTGFWESASISELNDRVLADLDLSWHHPFGVVDPRGERPDLGRWVDDARELIRSEFGQHRLMLLKDPRIALIPELWAAALEAEAIDARYVIVVRRPDEVARSIHARNGFSPEQALLGWAAHMVAAEQFTRGRRRVFVHYEHLLGSPQTVLDAIESGLGVKLPRRTRKTGVLIDEFLDAELRHQSYRGSLKIPAGFAEIEALYQYLDAASNDQPKNEDVPGMVGDWLRGIESTAGPIIARASYDLDRLRAEADAREAALAAALEAARTNEAGAAHDLERLRGEAEARVAALERQNDELGASVDDLRARLAGAMTAQEDAQGRLASAEKQIVEADLLRANAAALEAEREVLRSRLDAAAAAEAMLRADAAARRAAADTASEAARRELAAAREEAEAAAEATRRELAAAREEASERHSAAEAAAEAARRELAEAREAAEAAAEAARRELAAAREEAAAHQSAAEAAAEAARRELATAREAAEALQAAAETAAEAVKRDLGAAAEEVDRLRRQADDSEQKARTAGKTSDGLRQQLETAAAAADGARQRAEDAARELRTKEAELHFARDEREQYKLDLRGVEAELSALRSELGEARLASRQLMAAIKTDFAQPVRETRPNAGLTSWFRRRILGA